jgi:hypothetical protein
MQNSEAKAYSGIVPLARIQESGVRIQKVNTTTSFVMLSEAKNPASCAQIETLRCGCASAQGDMRAACYCDRAQGFVAILKRIQELYR